MWEFEPPYPKEFMDALRRPEVGHGQLSVGNWIKECQHFRQIQVPGQRDINILSV